MCDMRAFCLPPAPWAGAAGLEPPVALLAELAAVAVRAGCEWLALVPESACGDVLQAYAPTSHSSTELHAQRGIRFAGVIIACGRDAQTEPASSARTPVDSAHARRTVRTCPSLDVRVSLVTSAADRCAWPPGPRWRCLPRIAWVQWHRMPVVCHVRVVASWSRSRAIPRLRGRQRARRCGRTPRRT